MKSDDDWSQGVVEVADYPAHPIQVAISVILLLSSIVVLVRALSQGQALQGAAIYLVSTGVFSSSLFITQRRELKKIEQAAIEDMPYVKRGESLGVRRVSLRTLFLASVTLGPFILSVFLPATTWFSVVLGMITGFSLAQLGFILYVRSWESANSVRLERYKVTVEGGRGPVVVERGVRSRR